MKEWWNSKQTWISWMRKVITSKKGKAGIGYKEEGGSSKQGAQKNQWPTYSHCGKIGHTSNKC